MNFTKHPNPETAKNQEDFLEKVSPEERAFHEKLFRIGNATFHYHTQAKSYRPTEEDFKEWLSGLPKAISNDMKAMGFEKCLSVLSFTRYINEKNDNGMDAWMKEHLNAEDYLEYSKNNY